MKKLILATAVVALFTACHSTTEANITEDSTSVSIDTVKVDSLKVIDTTSIIDTLKK
jgi:hypothetical protein